MKSTLLDPGSLRSLYRKKKELFELVYVFNVLPAEYIHRSWIDSHIPMVLFQKLIQSRRGREKLSHWILSQNNLEQNFIFDFTPPSYRLALLPYPVLKKLTLFCGIVLYHRQITTVIGKKTKEKMLEEIGREGYLFALKRAPLLSGRTDYPSALRPLDVNDGKSLQHSGAAYLFAALAHAPESLLKRLLMKFPTQINQNLNLFHFNYDVNAQWLLLKRTLKHVIDPQWHPLFI